MNELGGLFRGQRLEYHGTIASRAKLSGPLANLSVVGFVQSFRCPSMGPDDRTRSIMDSQLQRRR